MQKSIKTSIVGIQHQNITLEIAEQIKSGSPITILPEPDNPYDKNAVAVFCDGHQIGYIRAIHAKTISPALRSSSATATVTITSPESISPNSRGIDVRVILTGINSVTPPTIVSGRTPGIYKIIVGDKAYIGQSSDINKRIATHWNDLSLGSHANQKLQSLWLELGPYFFRAEALLIAPSELSPYELQEWLGNHEYKEIKLQKELGKSLNILDGEIVSTKASESDKLIVNSQRIRKHDEKIRELKKETNAEIEALSSELPPLMSQRKEIWEQIKTKNSFLIKNSGFVGLFKGTLNRHQKTLLENTIEKLRKKLAIIDDKILLIQTKLDSLKSDFKTLKTAKQKADLANRRLSRHGIHTMKPEDFV